MYKDIDRATEEIIKPFYQKGEVAKAVWVQYKGKIYKEINFRKKGFGKNHYILRGILFLTEENEVVKDNILLEELEKLVYYYKIIFNSQNKNSIISTYEDKSSINRYEDDNNRAVRALDFLKEDGFEETFKIKETMTRVVEMRKEKNRKIEEIKKLEELIKANGDIFSDDILSKAYVQYEEVIKANFQSIKLINSQRAHYEELIKLVKKKKRSLTVRFNKDIYVGMLKLEYISSYFKRLLTTCESIVGMDQNSYMKYLRNSHREIIKENLKGLRAT
ncbi:hypothetical protein GCM10008905_05090 [Clostridium malenominatum]|uniref:Phage protein n=1 Tax=Clostridium malenominatum TaxID=1539 RepID=A0ABP3TYD9_9CLOT